MLIVLEGLDNCGKTTIAKKLNADLISQGYEVIYTHEFETSIGKEILRMSQTGELDPMIKTFLFACDRHMRLRNCNDKDFTEKIVLFDRYTPSAIAYRMAEGMDRAWVETINAKFRKADLTYYISITAKESIDRRTPEKDDLKYDEGYLNKVRNAYLDICNDYGMIQIDGMRSINAVYSDIFKDIMSKV